MLDTLVFLCVAFPVLAAIAVYMDKQGSYRKPVITITGIVLALSALGLAGSDQLLFSPKYILGIGLNGLITVLDFVLLAVIVYIGLKRKHNLITWLAGAQLLGMIILEFFLINHSKEISGFNVDQLSKTMVLVISIVGSLICYYGIGYMKEHEEHLHLSVSKQPRFFALMLLFLGAMNGLVLANNLTWLYFFWEVTTLCSFLLIGHDGNDEAKNNAATALWMNLMGGVAFVFAMCFFQRSMGTLSLDILLKASASAPVAQLLMVPVVALCFAGFTKSAQMPFQKWLCGAMVAPTPVSALLHSSTMVKAGVYLIIRLAPMYQGSSLSTVIAIFGAFTFLITAAMAVSQNNGKKILAYSTISNLGLIVACAGINTAASITAAMLLIIFHAISKGLLFLCVGAIEQRIGSRNIEDMRGLFQVMPRTALITSIGIITMMLPPFGMLLAKWMAIESAMNATAGVPILVTMLALGSGLTILFWGRWAGELLSTAKPGISISSEQQDETIRKPLTILAGAALLLSLLTPLVYTTLVAPIAADMFAHNGDITMYSVSLGVFKNNVGVFAIYPIYLVLALGAWIAWRAASKVSDDHSLPYMSGMQAEKDGKPGFTGPMLGFVEAKSSNYLLESLFGESKLTQPCNIIALAILVLMVGGVL